MKNIFKHFVSLLITGGVALTACEKEISFTERPATQIEFKNNMLVFNSVEIYDNTISNSSDSSTLDEINQLKKSKFEASKSDQELYPEFLIAILNSDQMVQIGDWIIKVDLQNNALSVTNAVNSHLVDKIKANLPDKEIFYFSTNDDVLYLLEQGSKGTLKSIQQQKGATPNNVWKRYYYHNGSNTEVQVRYYKAGIYYSLFSSFQINGVYAGQESSYVTASSTYIYSQVRTSNRWGNTSNVPRTRITNSKYYDRHYEGSKQLDYYTLNASFTVEFYNVYGNYITTQTDNLYIADTTED